MFTWNAYEALRVDPDFICHHLNVNSAILFRSKEHFDAVKEEVLKLK